MSPSNNNGTSTNRIRISTSLIGHQDHTSMSDEHADGITNAFQGDQTVALEMATPFRFPGAVYVLFDANRNQLVVQGIFLALFCLFVCLFVCLFLFC